ncbi:MAG TPA: prephenate dehydrogenase/arogenate dehydrogenase family protein [Gammaproteobacteria bacterium]|nr:prephenate dehydrogenase/arogenate dehydrogenase family protein [Gammaproteobacteria bacterium]
MKRASHIDQLTIIGVGLIGGSLARALKGNGLCERVIGCGRSRANLERARQLGVIDALEEDVAKAVKGSEVVVIAVPLGAMPGLLRKIDEALAPGAVLTDVGSAKGSVVQQARANLGQKLAAFVPGHPIAGSEQSGVEASRADLFKGRCTILTPVQETDVGAVTRVRSLWEGVGAQVCEMSPEEHDEVLAATSHLPHVLAYALMHTLLHTDAREKIFQFSAGGFRDFTRIASSDPLMWRDICLANRDAILAMLEKFDTDMAHISRLIREGDGEGILEFFSCAKAARDQYIVKEGK